MVLINFLKTFHLPLLTCFNQVTRSLYNMFCDGFADRVSIDHIREIFVANIWSSGKTYNKLEIKILAYKELFPFLDFAFIGTTNFIENVMSFIVKNQGFTIGGRDIVNLTSEFCVVVSPVSYIQL